MGCVPSGLGRRLTQAPGHGGCLRGPHKPEVFARQFRWRRLRLPFRMVVSGRTTTTHTVVLRKNNGRCFRESLSSADLQAAWVLLFYCGATRANFLSRNVQPAQTFWYAQQHDDNVWECFSRLTGFSQELVGARSTSSAPLGKGGLGLLSAVRTRKAAHCAIWADCLPMVHQRQPEVARMMVGGLEWGVASCFTAVRGCVQSLFEVGFEPPEVGVNACRCPASV